MAAIALKRLEGLNLPGSVRFGTRYVEGPRRLSCGDDEADALFGGGVPRGGLCEIVGRVSCGRTALAQGVVAAATRAGEATAIVDVPDALDPNSLSAMGADLERVLWLRPPSPMDGFKCADLVLRAGGFGVLLLDLGGGSLPSIPRHVWPRLLQEARRSGTALLVLAARGVTGSSSTLGVTLQRRRALWTPGPSSLFDGFSLEAQRTRNRHGASGQKFQFEFSTQTLSATDLREVHRSR